MAEAFTAGPMELSAGGAHPALSPHQARNQPFPPGAWWFLVEKDTQEVRIWVPGLLTVWAAALGGQSQEMWAYCAHVHFCTDL